MSVQYQTSCWLLCKSTYPKVKITRIEMIFLKLASTFSIFILFYHKCNKTFRYQVLIFLISCHRFNKSKYFSSKTFDTVTSPRQYYIIFEYHNIHIKKKGMKYPWWRLAYKWIFKVWPLLFNEFFFLTNKTNFFIWK